MRSIPRKHPPVKAPSQDADLDLAPHDNEAEKAVLGACLLDEDAPAECVARLSPSDFYGLAHQMIFAAIQAIHQAGGKVDLVTVAGLLRERGQLDDAGGVAYLKILTGGDWRFAASRQHVEIIARHARTRRRMEAAKVLGDPRATEEQIAEALAAVQEAVGPGETSEEPLTLRELGAKVSAVEWIWPNVIPRGFVGCIAGQEGHGKTWLALALVKSLTTGEPWPDGQRNRGQPGRALWVETEGRHRIVHDRAVGMSIPQDRLLFLSRPEKGYYWDKPEDRAVIIVQAKKVKPDLIVVDAWRGFFRGDENSSEVALLLEDLQRFAGDLNCAIAILIHLRKRGLLDRVDEFEWERLRGSSAFAAAMVWQIGVRVPDPDNEDERELSYGKLTHSPQKPPRRGFRIEDGQVVFGEPPELPSKHTETARAMAWLQQMLSEGPVDSTTVLARGAEEHFAERTLKRAKALLGVVSRRQPGGEWAWEMSKSAKSAKPLVPLGTLDEADFSDRPP
jgi:hypothetical protein